MSGSYSRDKGARWERDVCRLLVASGWQAITSRNARGGAQMGADVISDLPVCIEAKNQARMDLSGWLDQAVRQAPGDLAAVFVKRRQKPASQAYVVMQADQFLELCDMAREVQSDAA